MAEERGDCNREMTVFFERILAKATFASNASKWRKTGPVANPRAEPPPTLPESLRRPCPDGTVGRKRHEPCSTARGPMPKTEAELNAFLADLGISVTTVRHPPLFTVADSQGLRGEIPGGHTKNLFLKDKKDNYFLVTVGEEAVVDLKQIHHLIGAGSRVSFGKPEMLMELLGVIPGAVTVFGLINDTDGKVKVVLDEALMNHDVINGHPLTNEATTSIAAADLIRFVEATGHDPVILKVS
jgi:Ala-tRNA(Pro) deacylase